MVTVNLYFTSDEWDAIERALVLFVDTPQHRLVAMDTQERRRLMPHAEAALGEA